MQKRLFEDLAQRLRDSLPTYPEGKLDSIMELARDFGVSKATMQKALASLKAEGLLESFRGKGTFRKGKAHGPVHQGSSLTTLSARLRERILAGTYRIGQPLPKVGFISSQEGMSPDTVCAALKVLSEEGLVRKQGKRWLAGNPDAQAHVGSGSSRIQHRNPPAILLLVPNYAYWDKAYHEDHPGKFVQNFYLEIERMGIETHMVTVSDSDESFFSHGRPRIQSLIQSLGDRYKGTMYIAHDPDMGLLSWLGRFKNPVVWLDLECLVKDMDMRVISGSTKLFRCLKDEEGAVTVALDTLAGLGHRRIGFPMLRSPEFPWMIHRAQVLKEIAASYNPPMVIVENEHHEDFWAPKPWQGPDDFTAWLKSRLSDLNKGLRKSNSLREMVPSLVEMLDKEKSARFGGPVTAILAPNDYFAHQYYMWFREMGIKVPEDVTLLSFDNNHFSRPYSIASIDFGFSDLSYQVAHIFIGDIPIKADALHNLRGRPVLMGRETLASLKRPKGN